MDPNIDQSLRTPDGRWKWPDLSRDQMTSVLMSQRTTTLARDGERSLLMYRGRLYEHELGVVTVWSGREYPQSREEGAWPAETTTQPPAP